MPFVTALLAALAAWIGPLAVRALVGLGFSAVSYVGISAAFDAVAGNVRAQFGALGDYSGLLGLTGVDDAVEIVLAAWIGRLAIVTATKALRIAATPAA